MIFTANKVLTQTQALRKWRKVTETFKTGILRSCKVAGIEQLKVETGTVNVSENTGSIKALRFSSIENPKNAYLLVSR